MKINAVVGGPVSLLTLLFGAVGIFAQLDNAFGRLWHDEANRAHGVWPVIRDVLGNRLKAFLVLMGLGLLLVGALLFRHRFDGSSASALHGDGRLGEWGYRYVQISATMLVNGLVFATLYTGAAALPASAGCMRLCGRSLRVTGLGIGSPDPGLRHCAEQLWRVWCDRRLHGHDGLGLLRQHVVVPGRANGASARTPSRTARTTARRQAKPPRIQPHRERRPVPGRPFRCTWRIRHVRQPAGEADRSGKSDG